MPMINEIDNPYGDGGYHHHLENPYVETFRPDVENHYSGEMFINGEDENPYANGGYRGGPPGEHIPLAKCRVLYLGSAVPIETSDGVEAVQKPLRERYPHDQDRADGIDMWLTVYSSGVAMQATDDNKTVTWFPISCLYVSAAVKCVISTHAGTGERSPFFVALDSTEADNSSHPPLFSCIMRRRHGLKILECHTFVCKSKEAAMALVHACTHAYHHPEGWNEAASPPVGSLSYDESSNMHLIDAPRYDPDRGVPKEFFQSPPEQGYFYTSSKALVRTFQIRGNENSSALALPHPRSQSPPPRMSPPPQQGMYGTMGQQAMVSMGPPVLVGRPAPMPMAEPINFVKPAPMIAGPPRFAVSGVSAPRGYFQDWGVRPPPVTMHAAPPPMMMAPAPMMVAPPPPRPPPPPPMMMAPMPMPMPMPMMAPPPQPMMAGQGPAGFTETFYRTQSRPQRRTYSRYDRY